MSAEMPTLRIAARSDTGISRSQNQDYAYAGPLPGAEGWSLLAVADGVGGHARGEWASQRTIELLASSLGSQLKDAEPREAFANAVALANVAVNREAREQGAAGAATTLVAAVCHEGQAWWANVGDSRLYLVSGGKPVQVSSDHSWVAEQVRAGAIAPEDARNHPRRNVVTRTVGFDAQVSAETGGPIPLSPGETLVLCSDGLHGPVDALEIARTVQGLDPELAAERLVQLANAAGGPDNITVVIGRMEAAAIPAMATRIVTDTLETPKARRRPWKLLIAIAAGVLVAGAAATAQVLGFLL